ncbi:lysophospholipid acyltransferase family protein [Sorangium sp. So ce375]|uniref:lysophospholipid acyltransferase family protein n=1 Tax=Sorangium sp. So ce375 TaxID=3133306 RepID=UPI003F5BC9EF
MPNAPAPRFSAARRAIRRFIGRTWLSVFGWRVDGMTELPSKAVLIAAPHTSNWDFPFTLAVSYVLDLEFSWLGKHTLFEPPFGFFFRWLGGVPVDRRDRNNLVAAVVDVLKQRDELILVIAPEGTRSRTKRWKTGFYYVALGADVPILLGYLDFPRKRGGILHVFHPTGDIEADMAAIRRLYDGIEGKHPERMSEITLGVRESPANGAVQHP